MAGIENIRKIAVVGSGIMGTGITQAVLLGGYEDVVLCDIDGDALRKSRDSIEKMMRALETEESFKAYASSSLGMGQTSSEAFASMEENRRSADVFAEGLTADEIMNRLTCETNLGEAVSDVDFVIEAVCERLAVKQQVFKELSESAPAHAVCASNTSTLPVTKIALLSKRPENVIGMHFHGFTQAFNRLVEIMGGEKTANEPQGLGQLVASNLPSIGGKRLAVRLEKEAEGFIANRIAAPSMIYSTWLLDQAHDLGITLEQLHAAGSDLSVYDMVGLDLAVDVGISYQENLSSDFSPPKAIVELVKQGRTGRKAGKGIFDWDASGRPVVKEIQVEERTRDFLREHAEPTLGPAARLNEACRLLEMGVVKGCEVINEVERIGESHEGIFVLGADRYEEWAEKLETVAEKIGKPYLKPCEMMRSGRFKEYP